MKNSLWGQELHPYNQYEEEGTPNLEGVFAEFMAYHASSITNQNSMQNQEIQVGMARATPWKIIGGSKSYNPTINMKKKEVLIWIIC